jgi:P27 family predicted phage terminase small subunit
MRGRKPKPTALRLLSGNAGKRPLPQGEPHLEAIAPACPEWLDQDAKREWRRLVGPLDAAGVITRGDRAVFAGYCQSYSNWKAAEGRKRERAKSAADARSVFAVSSGEARAAALRALLSAEDLVDAAEVQSRKSMELMLRACVELGLTPSSRTRVKAVERATKETSGASRFFE